MSETLGEGASVRQVTREGWGGGEVVQVFYRSGVLGDVLCVERFHFWYLEHALTERYGDWGSFDSPLRERGHQRDLRQLHLLAHTPVPLQDAQ